jgi:hypothetical protein
MAEARPGIAASIAADIAGFLTMVRSFGPNLPPKSPHCQQRRFIFE